MCGRTSQSRELMSTLPIFLRLCTGYFTLERPDGTYTTDALIVRPPTNTPENEWALPRP